VQTFVVIWNGSRKTIDCGESSMKTGRAHAHFPHLRIAFIAGFGKLEDVRLGAGNWGLATVLEVGSLIDQRTALPMSPAAKALSLSVVEWHPFPRPFVNSF
jgi:hypothetical protein